METNIATFYLYNEMGESLPCQSTIVIILFISFRQTQILFNGNSLEMLNVIITEGLVPSYKSQPNSNYLSNLTLPIATPNRENET